MKCRCLKTLTSRTKNGGEVDDDNKEPESEPEVDNQDEDVSTDDDVMNTM